MLHYQVKLFNRIAYNYVKLIGYMKHTEFRDAFLNVSGSTFYYYFGTAVTIIWM